MPPPADDPRTARQFVRWGAARFRRARLAFGHGTDNAGDEAFQLVAWALRLPYDAADPRFDRPLRVPQRRRVFSLLERRLRSRSPAAYLTGVAWFAGLPFRVDRRVIVPRSPIAELIQDRFRPWVTRDPRRILDLCAGSGCIAIACAAAFPRARVDASELDPRALQVLRANLRAHRMGGRVRALRSDLFAALRGRRYDLIVSNPPYVPEAKWRKMPREYHHEPKRALAAGPDGLRIVDRILREAPAYLAPRGTLVCEVGGTMTAFQRRYRGLPALWPEFAHGGDGVFVVTREELVEWNRNHVR